MAAFKKLKIKQSKYNEFSVDPKKNGYSLYLINGANDYIYLICMEFTECGMY